MSNEAPRDQILSKVGDSRREFVRRVLVAAPFVAPIIASFTIADLGVESALARAAVVSPLASPQACLSSNPGISGGLYGGPSADVGYVGPSKFHAYLSDMTGRSRVNGDVALTVNENRTIDVDIDMVKGVVLTGAQLLINSVTVVPAIPLTGKPRISLSDTCGISDFDVLLQALANQQVTVAVQWIYNSSSSSAQATVVPTGNKVIEIKP